MPAQEAPFGMRVGIHAGELYNVAEICPLSGADKISLELDEVGANRGAQQGFVGSFERRCQSLRAGEIPLHYFYLWQCRQRRRLLRISDKRPAGNA